MRIEMGEEEEKRKNYVNSSTLRNHGEFPAKEEQRHFSFIPLGTNFSVRLLIPRASGENGLRIGYFIFV
jgi:hypothetical protein